MNLTQPLRPGQFAEQQIIECILDGTYPPGSVLPAERKLAGKLGVTRPTVRETLQRLASEGWVTIRHGKPTEVNYFWEKGGLRLLGTLIKYGSILPAAFIDHLLELRVILNPPIARQAVEKSPEPIVAHLERCLLLENDPGVFTEYDWRLQQLLARHSGNPVHLMILNDFKTIFKTMAAVYFSREEARKTSLTYYKALKTAITNDPETVEQVVQGGHEKQYSYLEAHECERKGGGECIDGTDGGMNKPTCRCRKGRPP